MTINIIHFVTAVGISCYLTVIEVNLEQNQNQAKLVKVGKSNF